MRTPLLICALGLGCRVPADKPDSEDTSPTDTEEPVASAEIEVTLGEERRCEAPELRAELGPMEEADGGPGWQSQPPPEGSADAGYGRGVAVADFDGDGLADLMLPNLGRDQLFINQGAGIWVDEARDRLPGWTAMDRTQGAYPVDIDDDGDVDLVTANRGNANRLLLNDGEGRFAAEDGGGFEDLPWGTVGASFGDLDGDGDLEVFFAAHFTGPSEGWDHDDPGPGDPSELYLNLGDGRFLDISETLPASVQDGYTHVGALVDVDLDADPDLYLVNDFGSSVVPNLLLRNDSVDGELALTDVSEASGAGVAVFGMGLGLGDLNGDLLPDLLVSSWDQLAMLESAGPETWYDSSAARGLVAEPGLRDVAWGLELVDMDNDGDLDAPVAFGHLRGVEEDGLGNPEAQPNALFIQDDEGGFSQQAEAWGLDDPGINRGFVTADLNDDGFLDLVTRDLDGPARMWLSRCDDNAWSRITLRQPAPNVGAVGARIEAITADDHQIRQVTLGATSFSTGGPLEQHLGLGDHEVIDRLLITWPDGERSVVEDLPARRVVTIERLPE